MHLQTSVGRRMMRTGLELRATRTFQQKPWMQHTYALPAAASPSADFRRATAWHPREIQDQPSAPVRRVIVAALPGRVQASQRERQRSLCRHQVGPRILQKTLPLDSNGIGCSAFLASLPQSHDLPAGGRRLLQWQLYRSADTRDQLRQHKSTRCTGSKPTRS